MTIVSIGEILWDVFDQRETLGGAPFNFAVHARRLGHDVIFLSAVGDDERGRAARAGAARAGLDPDFISVIPGTATGAVTVRLDSAGVPDFTIHRPAAYDKLRLDDGLLKRIRPDWICYGTLHQMDPGAHEQTMRLIERFPAVRRFYDVNLRRESYMVPLVKRLLDLADAVKVNQEEADLFPEFQSRPSVAVTRGGDGCAVRIGTDYAECPGRPVTVVDTVGAGDAFAAAFVHGLSEGWTAARTADFANRLGALVASRAGGIPEWSLAELTT